MIRAGATTTLAVGSITGLGTGVATALAVNVGSAGAFVTFNGALGTPSSGTGTNITGVTAANVTGTGVASATSLALGGATIGTNALAVTGTAALSSTLALTQATANTAVVTASGHSLTGSNNTSGYTFASTLNTTGASYDVFKIAVTKTATGASTNLFNILGGAAGASTYLRVDAADGTTYMQSANMGGGAFLASASTFNVIFYNAGLLQWSSTSTPTGTPDLHIGRAAAATLQQGAADAASPVAQTSKVQDVVGGTTDVAGVARTYNASAGTGTGAGGSHIFTVAPAAGGTASTKNAQVTALTINSAKQALFDSGSSATPGLAFSAQTNTGLHWVNSGWLVVDSAGTATAAFNASTTVGIQVNGSYPLSFANGAAGATSDSSFSRISAGVIGVGTGAAASVAGSLSLTNITQANGGTLKLGNSATTGLAAGVLAATTNATITITDQAGQVYRIPCII